MSSPFRPWATCFLVTAVVVGGCTMTTTPQPDAPPVAAPPPPTPAAPLERRADGSCHDGTAVVDCESRQPIVETPREVPPVETAPAETTPAETTPAETTTTTRPAGAAPTGTSRPGGTEGRPPRIDPSTLPKPSGDPGTEVVRRADGICWEISTGQKAHQPKQVQCP